MSIKKKLVQLKQRIGQNTWESVWTDITPWFIDRESDVSTQLDDVTLQGRIEQQSVTLIMNNVSGKFNPATTTGSLWQGSQFIYHSRIRYYEWSSDEQWDGENDLSILPLIDGLLAKEPDHRIDNSCTIIVSSMLDILREHFMLEDSTSSVFNFSSTNIVKYIADLFDTTYSELGVTTTNGIFRNDIIYTNIKPFSKDLYQLMVSIISDGGGVGGLTNTKVLFFTYYEAGLIQTAASGTGNFSVDASTLGCYIFSSADYAAGTSVQDISGNSNDLTVDNTIDTPWKAIRGNYGCRNFYRVDSNIFGALTSYSIEMILSIDTNRVLPADFFVSRLDILYMPIFMWSTETSTRISYSFGAQDDVKYEGFALDGNNKLLFISGISKWTPGLGRYLDITEVVSIVDLLSASTLQYLCINVDMVLKRVECFINGNLVSTIDTPTIGYVSSISAKNKIIGAGYIELALRMNLTYTEVHDYLSTDPFCYLYYSGMRISNRVRTSAEVFDMYTNIFGSSFTI